MASNLPGENADERDWSRFIDKEMRRCLTVAYFSGGLIDQMQHLGNYIGYIIPGSVYCELMDRGDESWAAVDGGPEHNVGNLYGTYRGQVSNQVTLEYARSDVRVAEECRSRWKLFYIEYDVCPYRAYVDELDLCRLVTERPASASTVLHYNFPWHLPRLSEFYERLEFFSGGRRPRSFSRYGNIKL